MAFISKDFTKLLNTLIDRQIKAAGRQTEWFNMSPDERADYIRQVNERLQEMQQSTLSVLAAQHFQMQDNPVSVGDQLQTLQQRRQQMINVLDTPAINTYKQQLDRDILLYSRQQTAMTHFDSTWDRALAILSPGGTKTLNAVTLREDAAGKQAKLDTKIKHLEQQLTTQVAVSTFGQKYVTLFSELQAYRDVNTRYNALLKVPPTEEATALAALTKVPQASDDLPVNISLLMMEERPGYIRMNVALVNVSTDGRFKDFFLENGRLVVPTDGVLNFSFGTAARSLAWQQQYRLKSEPPSFRSPTYTPIRSVLVKTTFVEKYFANYLVSESTLREGFKAQLLGNGRKMLLTNVDRKVPNQIGIQVSGQALNNTITREVPLPGVLSDLINQNADISSFQTIGLEGFRQNSYHPDRDGLFVNIHELERSVGFASRQYLLEMPQGKTPNKTYLSATPFVVMSVDGDKVSSSHLSKAQTAELYQYNAAFFEKLDRLRDDGEKASRLFNSSERTAFEQQLVRLLERNHITPAGVLESEYTYDRMRDIKGNNLNKVLWEQAFAASVWHSTDNDPLLFGLAENLVKNPAVVKVLQSGYVQSDIAQTKNLLAPLYEQWRIQAVEAETQRVASANAAQHPNNPKIQVFDQVAVERLLDGKLLTLLLAGPNGLESDDVQLRPVVEAALLSNEGRSLRKQVLFHVLRPVADSLSKAAVPVNPHAALGDNKVMINNRLNQPDPYLLLNTSSEELAYHDGPYLIKDDKYRSYNQFRPDLNNDATRYMNDLDIPFVGGISGTTQTVSNALPELFGSALSVKQYWQFQIANAAFMIRNGYHSFFETFYVAARYEPEGAGSIGKDILQMFDEYRVEGSKMVLQGELYNGVMARVLPIINQGLPVADEFHPPRFTRIGPMPALLGQAAKDLELRAGLASVGDGFESRQGSADIHRFATDPIQFAKTHTISAEALVKSGRLPAEGNAQLVKVTPNLYELEYTGQRTSDISTNSVAAYFLGYNGSNQANAAPAYVDIPKQAALRNYLFTSTLSGGSLVVTNLDDKTYRVYHDGRVNSSLLYDNVEMAVDYKDYQVSGTAEGLAAAYMQYVNGKWQLVFQRQEYQRDGQMIWPKLRGGGESLSIQAADSQVGQRNQGKFATYREQVHQQLKKVATQFGVSVEGVTDGVYKEGEFSPEHPAIAAWTRLREAVQAKVSADIDRVEGKRYQLQEARRTSSDTALIDQQIKQLNLTQDYYRSQYDSVLREADFVEKAWLWQQIKAKDGSAAVVRIDDTAIQGGKRISSVGERYAIAEAYQRGVLGTEFTDGLRNFREIKIPGVDDKTSVLDMKLLFLEGQLATKQRGALSGRITKASQAEYIDKVLRQTAVFSEDFHDAGSVFNRLIPQDFYLLLVGDRFSGRCYPLVRAMAVALARGGETGINSLVQKLFFASADPQAGSSTLLKNSLIKLHSNVEAVQASTQLLDLFNLSEVVSRLSATTHPSMFALNTQNHSMMVGITVTAEGRRYYFYDPNVGIFAFDNTNNLSRAMEKHLVGRNLAAHYGSFGSKSKPTFNLVEINTDKMAEVSVGNGLNVADLTRFEELASVIGQRRQVEQAVSAQERVTEDLRLSTVLKTFDAEQWGARFEAASIRLAQEHQLDSHWLPIIATTEEQREGRYRVQFINRDQPEQTRWLITDDSTFVKFRRFVDEHMSVLNEHFTLENSRIQPRGGIGEVEPVDGLNAGFMVQTLIQWFADKNRHDAASGVASPDLATALKVHSYLGLTQMAHGGIQDVAKITKLVSTALRSEVMAGETSLKDFTLSLGHTVNEGAGVLFGFAMVGLDAYELAHAENDVQKGVFGTQLAFDSASLVTGVAGVGAGLVGASTAAAVLGGAGVILGGLAVGFTALAQAFGAVAEDAKAVGRYFYAVDHAYSNNGYDHKVENESKVLVPLPGAVVKRLDLKNDQIVFDSQYIYRTHSGSTGSGEINYFFWIGDFPRMVHDRGQAIEVRSGIGYKEASKTLEYGDSVVILPGTPKSYIKYEYMLLPGATTRHDAGFDVIRRLEEDKRFDYDFYIFPGEQTIRRIHHEYVDTSIEVVLDKRDQQLVVPELPKELHGYLRYELKGAGGKYQIGLNEGTRVKLTNVVASEWIIDRSQLASDSISVSQNQLVVGGIVVELDPAQSRPVSVVSGKGEVHAVVFSNSKLTVDLVSINANEWQGPGQQIEQHLKELNKAHQLHGQYVVVENYRHNGRDVGRAFYDVVKDRMLFTDTDQEQARHAQLGAVIDDYAYFYDADNVAVWRVYITTGQVDAQFEPWFNQNDGEISRLWQEGETVYLARHYRLKEKDTAELGYQILGDRMELVSAVGDDELLQLLARTGQHDDALEVIHQGYKSNSTSRKTPTYFLGARLIQSTSAELVTVFGLDAARVPHRYWIRTSDGMLIKPNLAPPADQNWHFEAHEQICSAWKIPADLVLAGSMPQLGGSGSKEVFFFYSKKQKVLFRQEGPGQEVLDANQPSALRVTTPALANVINVNGHLIVMTEDGRVARLDALGQLSYAAVNEHWLKERTHWWKDLADVTGFRATLAVFGVKGTNDNLLPVWYHNGQVVVASAPLQDKHLQFLGFEADGSNARLFEPASGKLYRQPPMTADALVAAFGTDAVLEASAQLPAASELTPELHLKAAEQVDAGLRLTTVKGEILLRINDDKLRLVSVDKGWQQDNLARLPQALAEVAAQRQAKDVLILQGDDDDIEGWFDVGSGQVFLRGGIPAADNLRFVGIAAGKKGAYVYSPGDQTLYRVKNGYQQKLNRYSGVERIDSSLLFQGGGADDRCDELNPPPIDGVDSVVLHGGADSDTYRLSQPMWSHYRTVVIDNDDPSDNDDLSKALDRVIMPVTDAEKILVSRHGDDLILTDSANGTALVIRKAFGSQAVTHQHLQIKLEGSLSVINVDHLVKSFTRMGVAKGGLFELSWAIQ
ncbi:cytotoxin [Photorhabdus heterorhabditis]|uniref:Cytotoxin n=1 Tax=Photorhabdus heterorhabditis TaxID=880156 RepID=A0ABR5KD98_9GAMM|nr:TcdA/TcdB pore-forming domain-containing protein [Photorhabdus heterorhabditis]KOY62452.1 cytotoxin [Photorhabdus heterorhabditis]